MIMTNLEEHSYDEILILKVLADEADPSEEHIFREKYTISEIFRNLYFEMKEMWENSQALVMVENVDVDKAITNFITKVDKEGKKNRRDFKLAIWFAAIAATFLLGIIIYQQFFKNNQLEIVTTNNMTTIVLPDSSQVSINRDSKFQYPKYFKGAYREVTLSGEAYFKIKANKNHPFIINTNRSRIKVLGTEFNVNSSGKSVIISVHSGNVQLYIKNNERRKIVLTKGETGSLSLDDEILSKKVITNPNYNSWATGIFTFNQTSLADVVKLLEQYFHTKITFQNQNTGHCKLTANFNHQSLNSILEILEATFEIKVVKKDSILLVGPACEKN